MDHHQVLGQVPVHQVVHLVVLVVAHLVDQVVEVLPVAALQVIEVGTGFEIPKKNHCNRVKPETMLKCNSVTVIFLRYFEPWYLLFQSKWELCHNVNKFICFLDQTVIFQGQQNKKQNGVV